jgi:hypothetical protein
MDEQFKYWYFEFLFTLTLSYVRYVNGKIQNRGWCDAWLHSPLHSHSVRTLYTQRKHWHGFLKFAKIAKYDACLTQSHVSSLLYN